MRMIVPLFLLASVLLSTCHGSDNGGGYQIYPLRLKSGSGGDYIEGISCSSWRLGVEAHNLIEWKTVPQECEGYIGNYMVGSLYRQDSKVACREAYFYVRELNLTGDGKDIWVFDVDETTLSNLPYYAEHGFGVEPYNATSFNEWVLLGTAPALPESLKLYRKLLSLGIKIVFLTGRGEDQREVTASNLKKVGYYKWEQLILKGSSYSGKTSLYYKSAERTKLVEKGYRIVGNAGDQWSDILGNNTGKRTFKLPDPMYYIS